MLKRLVALWKDMPSVFRWLVLALAAIFFWYGILGTVLAGVKVDVSLRADRQLLPPGGSVTVGMLGVLVESQVNGRSSFTANDPFFYPTGLARRTATFQTRVMGISHEVAKALSEAGPAPELDTAVAELAVPADQWWVSPRWPFFALPAERHYQGAIQAISAYNYKLSAARKGRSGSNERTRLDQGSIAVLAALQQELSVEAERGDRVLRGIEKGSVSTQIMRARATAYAATLLLRGLQEDNAEVIRRSGLAQRWGEVRDALDQAATYSPLFAGGGELRSIGYSLLIANNAIHAIIAGG